MNDKLFKHKQCISKLGDTIRRKLNTEYISGILERTGGFAVHKNRKTGKYYLYFKVVSEELIIPKMMNYLRGHHDINFNAYPIQGTMVFYITAEPDVEKFIDFLKIYCVRQDYKRFKKTDNGYVKVEPIQPPQENSPKSI